VKILDVAHVALCGCEIDNGHGNYGFLWGRMTTELDDCRKYIHCPCVCWLNKPECAQHGRSRSD
jgi:hypothetical protein